MNRLALYRQRQDKIRDIRRKIVLEIIMTDPERKWTTKAISDAAREHKWFQEFMPTYSPATAKADLLAALGEIKERREELAEQYISVQLDILDDEINGMREDLDSLGTLEQLMSSDEVDMNEILKYARARATLTNTMLRLLERQGKLIPVEMPQKIDVSHSQVITLDMFLEARRDLELDDGMTIEGDFVEGKLDD
jgi:hypothetical protein